MRLTRALDRRASRPPFDLLPSARRNGQGKDRAKAGSGKQSESPLEWMPAAPEFRGGHHHLGLWKSIGWDHFFYIMPYIMPGSLFANRLVLRGFSARKRP